MKLGTFIFRLVRVAFLSVVGVTQLMFLIFGALYFFELLSSIGMVTESHKLWFMLLVPALLLFDLFFIARMIDIIRKKA